MPNYSFKVNSHRADVCSLNSALGDVNNSRATFEKNCLTSLRSLIKGTGWRKRDSLLFFEFNGFYLEANVFVHRSEPQTRVECSFKPMAVDRILWNVTGEFECLVQPLSFRSFGVGVCATFPLVTADIEVAGDSPSDVAAKVLPCCEAARKELCVALDKQPFSDLIGTLLERGARGNLSTTRIFALIGEGKLDQARAATYLSLASYGEVSSGFHRVGKSFEHQIIRWLDANPWAQPS